MITLLKIEAPPADKTEGAMICLDNDDANSHSRFTKAEFWYDLYTLITN